MANNVGQNWVEWFRHSSPYINAHRKRTMVLTLGGEAFEDDNFINIIHDIALLSSLGVRVVVAFGARPQIEARLQLAGISSRFHGGLRVTLPEMMDAVLEASGRLRALLEARLSMGVVNSPMHGARIRATSGNFVMAQPVGVLGGVDLCQTGQVRRIDTVAINEQLDAGAVVLLPSIGYSITGDAFNLSYEDVGAAAAAALQAEKLVLFGPDIGLITQDGRLLRDLTLPEAHSLLNSPLPDEVARLLKVACEACGRGVKRTHFVSYRSNGSLLQELFTRDGGGTMMSADNYEQIRQAQIYDVNGIVELIVPLEEQGVLVRRSRERLETEIDCFTVDERDGTIIGCAALYSFPDANAGELACFVVREDYRRHGRGDALLDVIERKARTRGWSQLYVLTTRTSHWFIERGFVEVPVAALPDSKRSSYNVERNSKVYLKKLASL
ncbi:MAG: amino-acid N-acetyltransferase [Hahellaceae bacterium]|nr:amino-acid N-acetyltransferase [Hahellaceae bacterium]MCP5170468.1 amino-acid N-acetyltransferase [Hahellaceae bacterium]